MSSPTERTLALLRKEGHLTAVVEKFNPYIKIRQDLFGFIDVVAIHPKVVGVLAVQTTSGTNLMTRIAKAQKLKALKAWLISGNHLEFHGWRKMGKAGKRKLWQVDRRIVTLEQGLIVYEQKK